MQGKRRLFVALGLSDEVTQEVLAIQQGLRAAKFAPQENLHITLAFIGAFEEERVAELEEALSLVQAQPFALKLEHTEFWKPDVLVAGVMPSPALIELQQSVCDALQSAGISYDTKPFRPHVTLARVKRLSRDIDLEDYLLRNKNFSTSFWEVARFTLFESGGVDLGTLYKPLAHFTLSR